jgi:ATP-dependent RNA helicase RhlB
MSYISAYSGCYCKPQPLCYATPSQYIMSAQHLTDIPFSRFDLPRALLDAIEQAGFSFCTPIQAETLPLTLAGEDVAGQAQTGTGKTAAFLIGTLYRLLSLPAREQRRPQQPRALILAPTRELAVQIAKEAEILAKHVELRVGLVYGGVAYEAQRREVAAGVDILIGTPGRLIDYMKQKVFDLKAVQVAVVDEADRMFDLGFIKDIRFLLRRMPSPEQRLNMLFSATLPLRVTELAYEYMNNPHWIRVAPEQVTAVMVNELLYHVSREEKTRLLLGLLKQMEPGRALIFLNTKRAAEKVQSYLEASGLHAAVLSGDVPQRKRQSLLEKFRRGQLPILVATDVAARGLHIPAVSHVINFDLPQDPEDYVHRIGRTARLGTSGEAISFACEEYVFSLEDIERFIGHKIPVAQASEDLLATPLPRLRRPPRPRDVPKGRPSRRRAPAAPLVTQD